MSGRGWTLSPYRPSCFQTTKTTKTVVIPPHEQWMDSLLNYLGNETVDQRKAGTHLDCVIIGGCTYQTEPMVSDPQLKAQGPDSVGTQKVGSSSNRSSAAKAERKVNYLPRREVNDRDYQRRSSQFPELPPPEFSSYDSDSEAEERESSRWTHRSWKSYIPEMDYILTSVKVT